ncbi:MAG: Regulator of polyketide synthase expression [uncultured Rubrobacteraceae bacterium]|uniref:Regulator of polyketide synthase expression n=1 Tax=uncultured Rubrobacteraceae bacterium TaxID=349277 RepID=A0A6J4NUI4_9ACTN|nr:MAG: Regulator of polyketide synthase expression [uncultured Rubrobacteraceae bacterium]
MIPARYTALRTELAVILKDFSRVLLEELGADCPLPGDPSRAVSGLAVDEPLKGWLGRDEAAVTARPTLDDGFLGEVAAGGSPAVVWRSEAKARPEVLERASALGLALFELAPDVPLRRLSALFGGGDALLLLSHGAGRALLEGAGGESSVAETASRVSGLLGRSVVIEDPVGRVISSAPNPSDGGQNRLRNLLEERGLRASRSSGVEETRRERRDRYARLPDGYLSVPVERWRVEDHELFWTPIGTGAPAGYLWVDLEGETLGPEDVVFLYWARRVLETELGKDRVRLETELGVRGDFVDDLVKGHYGSVNLLLQRAGYLGADLAAGALVLIVDIDDFARYLERRRPREPAIQELKRRLAEAVRMQTRQLFSNFLLGPRSDNVIVFLGSSEDTPPEDLPEKARLLAKGVQRYVKGLLPDLTISVGIGRHKTDPALLPDAYSEAEVALEIGHRIHGPSAVSTFEGAGTYKLLFRVLQENPEELESFYRETLEPVVRYDSRYSTELVQTLVTYLGNDASTVRTASDLYAHRHTIRYRLDRVGELTGLDVDKSEDRERITLGIKAMQLLGRVPERPTSFADR